jgi:hypothetical protein
MTIFTRLVAPLIATFTLALGLSAATPAFAQITLRAKNAQGNLEIQTMSLSELISAMALHRTAASKAAMRYSAAKSTVSVPFSIENTLTVIGYTIDEIGIPCGNVGAIELDHKVYIVESAMTTLRGFPEREVDLLDSLYEAAPLNQKGRNWRRNGQKFYPFKLGTPPVRRAGRKAR